MLKRANGGAPMAKRTISSNVTWRTVGGQHLGRWNPGPELRKAGFRAVDLWASPPGPQLDQNGWLAAGFPQCPEGAHLIASKISPRKANKPLSKTVAERMGALLTGIALGRCQAIRDQVVSTPLPLTTAPDAHKYKTYEEKLPKRKRQDQLTLNDLFDDFMTFKEREVQAKRLAANSYNNLRANIRNLRVWCGDFPPMVLTKEIVEERFWYWRDNNGHAAADKLYGALRTALNWADGRQKYLGLMPPHGAFNKLNLPKSSARLRVGTPEEMTALLTAFDDPHAIYDQLGTPFVDREHRALMSGGDAMTTLLWTCARVGDGLSLRQSNLVTIEDRLMIDFRPSKSVRKGNDGKWVMVPVMGPLAARLAQMQHRLKMMSYVGPYLIVRERHHDPYIVNDPNDPTTPVDRERKHQRFTKVFNERLKLAGKICTSLLGEGYDRRGRPIQKFQALDFRDTAATRLYAATGSLESVSVYHGSSPRELAQLMAHYIEVQPEFAQQVGSQLDSYCQRNGISI